MLVQTTLHSDSDQDCSSEIITFGIDMGQSSWVCGQLNRTTGKYRQQTFRGEEKEENCYSKVAELVNTGKTVFVIYEASRFGFTPARNFTKLGAKVIVIPVNRLQLVQYGKRVKTDRLDARLLAHLDPFNPKLPSVYVPSIEEECDRGMAREEKRLEDDIKRKNNQLLSILERWPLGVQENTKSHRSSQVWLDHLTSWRSSGKIPSLLPESESLKIKNLIEELQLLEKQLVDWREMMHQRDRQKREVCQSTEKAYLVDVLTRLRGIGLKSSRILAWGLGDWNRFSTGKKFSSIFGLTPTPWSSGKLNREQGISKAGSGELRRVAVELAWLWVRWQPGSKLTQKWLVRLSKKGRARRIAIVGLARQLMVALYRFAVKGDPIEGAVFNKC